MLYLEQPVQVGFSYDTLRNITADLLTGEIAPLLPGQPPRQNLTTLVGTLPSGKNNSTTVGTRNSAIAMWHFAQVWFQEFPGYHPHESKISIATESYGGRYGPDFAAFFEEQNERIRRGEWDVAGEQYVLNLDTLFLINACVDREVMWPHYPTMAYNNTYGVRAVNESVYEGMLEAYYREGGCRDQIEVCQGLAREWDPKNMAINETVNRVCEEAETFCSNHLRDPYTRLSGRNYYDIGKSLVQRNPWRHARADNISQGQQNPDPFTFPFHRGYLNQPHVQAALGVPLNFTQSSAAVSSAFRSIGDYPRPGWLEDLAHLLESGVKVTLVYGDRDFACNWYAGEAVSLAINHTRSTSFRSAGYTPIVTNSSYIGGQVRQYGNLSFSRVYESGHEVPAYQPETAYQIFTRALFNKDIATGEVDTAKNGSYATEGPNDTLAIKNELPKPEIWFCYTVDLGTCTDEQIEMLKSGNVTVRDWIVVDANSTRRFPHLNETEGSAPTGTGTAGLPSATGPVSVPTGTNGGGLTLVLSGHSKLLWVCVGACLGLVLL